MAKFNLEPLEDRIVVKPGEEEETTVSGIVIPDTAKEKPQEGEVVAVGPGRFEEGNRIPMDVKVGDKVIYSKYGGTEVKIEGDEYLILSARDVLAIVKKLPPLRKDFHASQRAQVQRGRPAGPGGGSQQARRRRRDHPGAEGPKRRP